MSQQNTCLIALVVLCASFCSVYSLYCYECSSFTDEKCGMSWGYDNSEETITKHIEDNLLRACNGSACKKFEWRDGHHGNLIVTRSCWDIVDNKQKLKCNEFMTDSKVCYCAESDSKDGKTFACNGKQPLQARLEIIALILLPFVCKILYR